MESRASFSHTHEQLKSVYAPLNESADEIRLLVLSPARSVNAKLEGSLLLTCLSSLHADEVPTYETISYVWGEPDFSASIVLDGQNLAITPRVAAILGQLRLSDQTRTLWIDSVCIDQSNVLERGCQVAIMRKIYSHGQRNLVWMIPADFARNEIWAGMDVVRRIVTRDTTTLKAFRQHFDDSKERRYGAEWRTTSDQSKAEAKGDRYFLTSQDEGALHSLFSGSPIWQRAWIVQELTLAPSIVLLCPGGEVRWDTITTFLEDETYADAFHAYEHGGMASSWKSKDIFGDVKAIEDQRRGPKPGAPGSNDSGQAETGTTLLDVLVRFRNKKATDMRDKIYSLLSLTTQDHGLQTDYTLSVEEVFRRTALALTRLSNNLDILCQNPFEADPGYDPYYARKEAIQIWDNLPSWVLRFNICDLRDSRNVETLSILYAQRGIFRAGSELLNEPVKTASLNHNVLVLRGAIVGTVGSVHYTDKTRRNVSDCETLTTHLGSIDFDSPDSQLYTPKVTSGLRLSTYSEPLIQAFWRTIVLDCAAPPRMRRLEPHEITKLHSINTKFLSQEQDIRTVPGQPNPKIGSHAPCSLLGCYYCRMKSQGELSYPPYIRSHFMFAVADNGLFLNVRPWTREGDKIAVLDGAKVPMILRERRREPGNQDAEQIFLIVGPAYVHGLMDGEVETAVAAGHVEKQRILIE